MKNISHRERIIILAAVGVIGLMAVDFILLRPLLDRLDLANARIAAAREDVEQARLTFDSDQRAAMRWEQMAGNSLAADAPTAEGQVMNHAQQWAQASGLNLSALRPERNERERDFQRITIRYTGTGNMQQVSRFLFAVENADFPLRVSDLQITSRREGTDDLSVQIGLSTIYLSPEPARPGQLEARR